MTQPNAKLVEVARAMRSAACEGTTCWLSPGRADLLARAAIRALMEPSEDMVEAGSIMVPVGMFWFSTPQSDARDVYCAMLGKVLEEEG